MSKIRSIKPEFFLHDGLFDLEQETGFPIRVAFAGLWTQCDREGRFRWRPKLLKIQILPYDDVDFSRVLDALVTRAFVVKYEAESQAFGWIPSFTRHQVINNREATSRLPPPPESDACTTRDPRVNDATGTPLESTQVEGNGKEGNGTGIGGGRERVDDDAPPADKPGRFKPPTLDEVSLYVQQRGNRINATKFHAYYESNGWMVGRAKMKDWQAAVRKWEQDDQQGSPRSNGSGGLSFAGIQAFMEGGDDGNE